MNEGLGNYSGEGKCSIALEFSRNRNTTLEIIIRMAMIGLRE